jgi:hypothetical protein
MKPMIRSVLIQRAPAKTWKKSSPNNELLAMVTINATMTRRERPTPHNGTNGPVWALGAEAAVLFTVSSLMLSPPILIIIFY